MVGDAVASIHAFWISHRDGPQHSNQPFLLLLRLHILGKHLESGQWPRSQPLRHRNGTCHQMAATGTSTPPLLPLTPLFLLLLYLYPLLLLHKVLIRPLLNPLSEAACSRARACWEARSTTAATPGLENHCNTPPDTQHCSQSLTCASTSGYVERQRK